MPKVVVVVVDQMIYDYVDFTTGSDSFIEALRDKGTDFGRTLIDYLPTSTSTCHATLATGEPPKRSGIVGESWFAGESFQNIKMKDNLGLVSNRFMSMEPLAESARSAGYRVLSISGKCTPAVLLGNSADVVMFPMETGNGEYIMIERRDALSRLDLSAASHTPRWIRDNPEQFTIKKGEIGTIKLDLVTLRVAENLLRHELKYEQNYLLFISLSTTDYIGHKYGPYSPEIASHIASLDKALSRFFAIESLEEAYVFLTSDHGAVRIKWAIKIRPRVSGNKKLFAYVYDCLKSFVENKHVQVDSIQIDKEIVDSIRYDNHFQKHAIICEGVCRIYVKSAGRVKKVKRYFEDDLSSVIRSKTGEDCIESVLEISKTSMGEIQNLLNLRAGDLLIMPSQNCRFIADEWMVPLGEHGGTSSKEKYVPLIISGPRLHLDKSRPVTQRDLVPTICEILNIRRPCSQSGRSLVER